MAEEISIIDIIRNEGISIKESFKGGRFRCPFHDDRNPSGFAYRDTNRFFCFGCGEKGDAIDLIMKLKGMGFRDAKTYLENRGIYPQTRADGRWRRKQILLRAFREWESQHHDKLTTIYRVAHKVMEGFKTMDEVEEFAPLYHELSLIENQMGILLWGTDEQKYSLFREVSGEL
jgi:hypothetical protein